MKNRGFTLIELLAVIVILAIIALIATPIILNIIDNTKDQSVKRSVDHYMNAVTNAIARENLNNTTVGLNPDYCTIEDYGETIDCYNSNDEPIKEDIVVKVDGEKPTGGTITFENGKITGFTGINIDGNTCELNDGEIVCSGSEVTPDPEPEPNPEPEPDSVTKPCSIARANGSTTGYSVSDVVNCGEESFYVIEAADDNATSVKMLTKYLVEVNSANPKQTSSEAYTTPDKASDIIGKYIDVLETTIKGDITGDLLSQDLETALYNNYEWMKRVDNNYINYWLLQEFSPGAGISMRRVSLDGTAQYVQVSSSYGIRPVITIETSNIQ